MHETPHTLSGKRRMVAAYCVCASVQNATNSGVEVVRCGVTGLVSPLALHNNWSYYQGSGGVSVKEQLDAGPGTV